jgi:gluconate 5-dehydrogenase
MAAAPLFDLTGRTALITGSSRGIGLELARGLAAAGARVVLNGRDAERVRAAVGGLVAEGIEAVGVPFDVTDPDAVAAGVAQAEDRVGQLDILVNNAGVQIRGRLDEYPVEDWQHLLACNLTSAFLVARAVAPAMIRAGRGKIVNILSLQSELARPGIAPYAASKGALKMLTRGMCADWAPLGLCVNAIGPGYIATELTASLQNDPDFDGWVRRRTPAGRWGQTSDLVGAAVFLAAPASDFVNGQIIYVDGGLLAVV